MKKIKYFIIAAAALISGSAMAQKVVCPDVTFDQDGKANLVFSIESEEPSTLCEFFLTMPEGISIEEDEGEYNYERGDMLQKSHTVSVMDRAAGDIYVLIKNESGKNFKTNSGTLITIPIVAGDKAVSGPNTIKVADVNITNLDPKQINTETEFDITVTVSGDPTAIAGVNGAAAGSLKTFKAVKKNQIVVVSNGNEFTVGGAANK
jgi:hypothetical protein